MKRCRVCHHGQTHHEAGGPGVGCRAAIAQIERHGVIKHIIYCDCQEPDYAEEHPADS